MAADTFRSHRPGCSTARDPGRTVAACRCRDAAQGRRRRRRRSGRCGRRGDERDRDRTRRVRPPAGVPVRRLERQHLEHQLRSDGLSTELGRHAGRRSRPDLPPFSIATPTSRSTSPATSPRTAVSTSCRSTRSECSTADPTTPVSTSRPAVVRIAAEPGRADQDRRRTWRSGQRQGRLGQPHGDRRNQRHATSPSTRADTRPTTSNVNIVASQFVTANGAMVKLSAGGDLCVYSRPHVHLIIDINGVWE